MAITDRYGRTFKTLRVSLTNTCNFGCVYCAFSDPKQATQSIEKPLHYKEIIQLISLINTHTPINTIRITGGEPTLYTDLIPFLNGIKEAGFSDIRMTSNGYQLKDKLTLLKEAGLSHINISLDTTEVENFEQISGKKNHQSIVDSIDLAKNIGLTVKLNAVIINQVNDNQIIPLLQFAGQREIPIRFLELMRMGPMHQQEKFQTSFYSEQEILSNIGTLYSFNVLPRKKSSTANYWETSTGIIFGIIANESTPFCHDCDRLRLDSFGKIYGCLSNEKGIQIASNKDLQVPLKEALESKQSLKFKGSNLSMMEIGG